jgi:hypothetical protein
LARNCGKIFGQFGQNLAKSGSTLEKDSKPRGLPFYAYKNVFFLKQELI